MNTLVIVESPTKAHTIGKFLGKDYTVMASTGHIRDLPEHGLSIRVTPEGEHYTFDETYEISEDKTKIVSQIVAAAKKADTILLASDPDREGEAIAWHLDHVLREKLGKSADSKTIRRIRYNEITHSAIRAALANPLDIDTNLVNAQRYRRILDRFVGWKVSPVLRNAGIPASVARTLSAGRVQSVALRMVCERDRAIEAFVPETFWKYQVTLQKASGVPSFPVMLQRLDQEKADVRDEATHQRVLHFLETARYAVSNLTCERRHRYPEGPFTTSQLQQASSNALRITPKRTMTLAQELYQQGLITYMRTDGRSVAKEAQAMAARFIDATYGPGFAAPKSFENKAGAQGAHEGIRPTDVTVLPTDSSIPADARSLYKLIWERFVCSQMKPAEYELTTAHVTATAATPTDTPQTGALTASVSKLLFPGFLKVVPERIKEAFDASGKKEDDDRDTLEALPPLSANEPLTKEAVTPECKQTRPPARFNEASLIRAMEKEGIGRPATYAATIDTLEDRKYVTSDRSHKLISTELGRQVVDFLVKIDEKTGHGLFYTAYTREMEAELDKVAHEWHGVDPDDPEAAPVLSSETEVDWQQGLSRFYNNLLSWLDATHTYVPNDIFRDVLAKFHEIHTWAPPRKDQKRTFDDRKTVQDFAFDYMGIERQRGKSPAQPATYTFDASQPPAQSFHATLPQLRYLLSILARYQDQVPELPAFGAALEARCFPGRTDDDAVAIRESLHTAFIKPETNPVVEAVITQLEAGGVVERDKTFYESLRDQVRRGRQLSPKQLPYLFRIFHAAGQAGFVKDYGPDLCTAIGLPWSEPDPINREEVGLLIEALSSIQTWNPAVTRGKRTYDDHSFVDSVAEQYRSNPASMTARQVQALENMLARYADQLPSAPALMERFHIAPAKRPSRAASATKAAPGETSPAAPAAPTISPETHEKIKDILKALSALKSDKFVKSVASQYERKKTLSEKQVAALEKVLARNLDKLPDAAPIAARYNIAPNP